MQIKHEILAGVVMLITAASTLATGQALVSAVPLAAAQAAQTKAEQPDQPITVTGCIMREADYRRMQDAGKGGVAGTGVGVGNEFVLTSASTQPAGAAASAGGATPTGTSGTDAMSTYELTGPNEARAQEFVGKRVEISGTLKRADTSAAGATGGPTAGKPPSGVDVTSKDLKLRELEVTSVRAATTGTCPAK